MNTSGVPIVNTAQNNDDFSEKKCLNDHELLAIAEEDVWDVLLPFE